MRLKPKLNLRYKLWKGIGSLVFYVSVKRFSLIVYVLKFFLNFGRSAWQCCGKGERDSGYQRSGFDPELRSSFFLIETLSRQRPFTKGKFALATSF